MISPRFSPNPNPVAALVQMTKRADPLSAFYEATLYAGFDRIAAAPLFGAPEIDMEPLASLLDPMPPKAAQSLFLQRFHLLDGSR
jgi:hypothetical protein